MADAVTLEEIEATVRRMEERLLASPTATVAALAAAYQRLLARFSADLGAALRDVAIAKASALMLIQEVSRANS